MPWLILGLVAVPLIVIAYAASRRKTAAGERPATATAQARAKTEQEFAEAEAYQDRWREEDEKKFRQERLP
jgi:hypothetical protein